jgi:hypothetical protein
MAEFIRFFHDIIDILLGIIQTFLGAGATHIILMVI